MTKGVLQTAIGRHLELRRAAYGAGIDQAAIKAHQAQHLPDMLERHGTLLSTFVQERQHRLLTKYAWEQNNTRSYEVSIIEQLTIEKIDDMKRPWLRRGLLLPRKPTGYVACALRQFGFPRDTQLSARCKTSVGTVCVDDIVALRHDGRLVICEIVLLLESGKGSVAITSHWSRINADDHTVTCDTTCRGMTPHALSEILATLIYTKPAKCTAAVLLPAQLRE